MKIHFRVTVYAGKRTKTVVEAHSTAVNPRTLTLVNGVRVSEKAIEDWIEEGLTAAIERLGRGAVVGEHIKTGY